MGVLQGALCTLYNIGHYPTLKFGRPADFEASRGGKLEDYSGVRAEKEIIEWVGSLQSTCAPLGAPSTFLPYFQPLRGM